MMDKNHTDLLTLIALVNGSAELEAIVRDIKPRIMKAVMKDAVARLEQACKDAQDTYETANDWFQADLKDYAQDQVHQFFTVDSVEVVPGEAELTVTGTISLAGVNPHSGSSLRMSLPLWYHNRKAALVRLEMMRDRHRQVQDVALGAGGLMVNPNVDIPSLLLLSEVEKATLAQVKDLLDTIKVNVAAL